MVMMICINYHFRPLFPPIVANRAIMTAATPACTVSLPVFDAAMANLGN